MVSSVASTSSSKSDMSVLEERLSVQSLEALACHRGKSQRMTVQTPPMRGSYNLVYPLLFPDGRKWVARIPDPESLDTSLMLSTVYTVHLIRDKTNIPIPAIHAYDISSDNEIGTPYIFMDYVEGVPLSRIWKDEEVIDDAARRRIFEQIAHHMSQLKILEFDKIGHLRFDEDSGRCSVGPYRRRTYDYRTDTTVIEESGPFATSHALLSHLVQSLINSPDHHGSISFLLRIFALFLPDPQYDGPPFVLSHPDFNPQNIMVDPETLNITGFIDWDGVNVGPRLGGFARYPCWITRDWDPALYNWREPDRELEGSTANSSDGQGENDAQAPDSPPSASNPPPAGSDAPSGLSLEDEESPEALQRYRDLYLSIYSLIDPQNADITRQSHIFEALDIALHNPELAGEILRKLCGHVFDIKCLTFGQLLLGVRNGDWMKSFHMETRPSPSGS